MRPAQGARRLTTPDQVGRVGVSCHGQLPSVGRLRVVAIRMLRNTDLPPTLARHPSCDAVNELAGTAGQHHAPDCYTMKIGKLLAQRGVGRVWVTAGVAGLHGQQRLWAGSASITVRRKIVDWHAQRIRPTVNGGVCWGWRRVPRHKWREWFRLGYHKGAPKKDSNTIKNIAI